MGKFCKLNGYSLMECLIATSLVLVTSVLATPSLSNWFEKQEVKSALFHTGSLLKQARNEAFSQGVDVTIVIDPMGAGCIGATANSSCDCFVANACELGATPRSLQLSDYNSEITSTTSQKRYLQFNKLHGFLNGPGITISLQNQSYSGNVIVSSLGRIRLCTDQTILGVPQC